MAQARGQHRKTSKQVRWAALGAVGTAVGVATLAGAAPSASAGNSGWGRAATERANFASITNVADLQAQIAAQAGFDAPAAAPVRHGHEPVNFAAYPQTREGIVSAILFTGHRAEPDHRSVSAGIADHLGIPVPEGFRPVAPTE